MTPDRSELMADAMLGYVGILQSSPQTVTPGAVERGFRTLERAVRLAVLRPTSFIGKDCA